MECPHCGTIVYLAAAWDGGEPDYEPGWLCPECGEFVSDAEAIDPDEDEA